MTFRITLRLACSMTEQELEEWIGELLTEAQTHLLDGEELTIESIAVA